MAVERLNNCIVRLPYGQRFRRPHRHAIVPADNVFRPRDVDEATDFIVHSNPPEVAVYAGSPEVQRSVAREIATTLFLNPESSDSVDAQTGEEATKIRAADPLPLAPDARRHAVSELISHTVYCVAITPVDGLTPTTR